MALLKEIDLFLAPDTADAITTADRHETIESIYIGGGTPSLCSIPEISAVIEKIRQAFRIDPDCEITLEANPDDISNELLHGWKSAGINRLSIGVQSFYDEDLQWMNRAHSSHQAIESLNLAINQFPNITIDLIYGTPQLTNDKWKHNVDTALALDIPHLSCYALTVEPKTPLDKMIRQHKSLDIDQGVQSDQFLSLMQWMEDANYEHYEISNFAKPGFRSRHNSSYWQGKNYFGFGPSAHSFDGSARWWNISNNTSYIQSIQKGVIPFEKETLTEMQKLNEYIMISLRTKEGLDLECARLYTRPDNDVETVAGILFNKSKKFVDRRFLIIQNNRIQLTKEGKLHADGIAAEMFFSDGEI